MSKETIDALFLARELGTNSRRTNVCLREIELLRARVAELEASLPSPDYQRGQEEDKVETWFEVAIWWPKEHAYGGRRKFSGEDRTRLETEVETLTRLGYEPENIHVLKVTTEKVAIRALPAQQESVCEWKRIFDGSNIWQAACGHSVIYEAMPDGTCKCGRPIRLGGGE